MSIADFASSAVFKIVKSKGKKLKKQGEAPAIPKATPIIMKNPSDDLFNVGFASLTVMPENVTSKAYWLAGYRTGNKIEGIIDPLTVNAMWIDCKDGGGILLVSCDFIGLTGFEVREIRESLADFCKESGCRNITVSCTHSHASIDTVGYWGKLPKTGKDKSYMLMLIGAVKSVCIDAYKNRREGKLFAGSVHVPEAIRDGREPIFCNDLLTRLRFVPNDGSTETWYLNYSAHPNTLGGKNSKISADYPAYLRRKINESKKTNVLFSVGAIAAVNIADLAEDNYERTVMAGNILGEKALGIGNDRQLTAEMLVIDQPYYAPIDNDVLAFMDVLHVVNCLKYPYDSSLGLALLTEMTFIRIGDLQILTLPGEAFPECVYSGGYSPAETSATGKGPEINPTPLAEIAKDDNLVIFGVTNDMTGYIVPPNDSILHPTQPYLSSVRDRFDRNHYHETNSLGSRIAFVVADTFRSIMETVNSI